MFPWRIYKISQNKAIEAYAVAVTEYQKGNIPKAIKFWKKVTGNQSIEERIRAKANLGLGFAYSKLDKYKEALSSFKDALIIFQKLKDEKAQAESLGLIGGLYFRNNLIKEALNAYQTALFICRKIKNKEMEADILGDIGSILDFLDKYDDAIDFFTRALKIYRKIPRRKGKRGEGRTLYDLGLALFHANKLEGARSHLEKSIRLMKKNNDKKGEANCNVTLADIHLELKETEIAEKYYNQALKYFQSHKNILGIINCEIGFGKIIFERGDFIQAKDKFEEVLRLATEANYLKLQATALLFLSKIYNQLDNAKEAENSDKKANKILKDLGIKLEEAS